MRSEGLKAGVWRGAASSPEKAGAEQIGVGARSVRSKIKETSEGAGRGEERGASDQSLCWRAGGCL